MKPVLTTLLSLCFSCGGVPKNVQPYWCYHHKQGDKFSATCFAKKQECEEDSSRYTDNKPWERISDCQVQR